MAYVASVKRLVPMLDNPGARVLVAVNHQPYVDTLLNSIKQRIDEGAEEWRGALLFLLAEEVRMPNGAVLTIKAIYDIDDAREYMEREWDKLLFSYFLEDDVKAYMRVGNEQFEEWRELFPPEQPKEPDDADLL